MPNSPVTHAGRMYLALDTDPLDAPPSGLAAMTTNKYQASSLVYQQCVLSLGKADCDLIHTPYTYAFVKEVSGVDPPGRSSTVARLFVASSAGQAGTTATLRVRGLVELVTPQVLSEQPVVRPLTIPLTTYNGGPKSLQTIADLVKPWSRVPNTTNNTVGVDIAQVASNLVDVAVTLADSGASAATAGTILNSATGWFLRLLDGAGNQVADVNKDHPVVPHC